MAGRRNVAREDSTMKTTITAILIGAAALAVASAAQARPHHWRHHHHWGHHHHMMHDMHR